MSLARLTARALSVTQPTCERAKLEEQQRLSPMARIQPVAAIRRYEA